MAGGGGASGRTDFPNYMKVYHQFILGVNELGLIGDAPVISVIEAFNSAASGNSPYFSYKTNQLLPDKLFFPDGKTISDAAYAKPFDLLATLTQMNFETLVDSKQVNVANQTWISQLIAAQIQTIDDEIEQNITPKLHANMRSIGAVNGSAFVIADALIQDSKVKAIAKTRLDVETLGLQREELAFKEAVAEYQFRQAIVTTSADVTKYYHTIRMEMNDKNAEFVAQDLLWDLKLFQYATNPLGSISGSAVQVDSGKASMASSAITGAMSGAAMGAMMGSVVPGIGNVAGAVIGGVMGLAGGLAR